MEDPARSLPSTSQREREASFEANTSGALVLDLWLVDCEKNKCALLTLLNVVVVALADGYINYLL